MQLVFPWIRRLLYTVAAVACPAAVAAGDSRIDFSRDIQPILSSRCYPCHGQDEGSRKAKLRLDLRTEAVRPREKGFIIKPGVPEASDVIRRIVTTDPDEVMPPPKENHPLSTTEKDLLRRWVAEGAEYAPHWAWIRPAWHRPPDVKDPSWLRNGIDNFILAKLEGAGIPPSSPAEPHALIRRVSLDLTGLPPTPAEVEAFLADRWEGAYERLVDRLLRSPKFGERWARMWLDLARYADSAGYGSDPLRPNIWPYRDWVIRAFNRNLSYDQFTREQIGGDLIPGADRDQVVATAFHRNTMTNTEGGTDDEEWRVAAVKDRAAVTAQVWMGLTMNCAQCHSHKYDPITQREYYSFYGFFNQTEDYDQPDERPTMPYHGEPERRERRRLETELARLEPEYARETPAFREELNRWLADVRRPVDWSVSRPVAARSLETNGAVLSILPDGGIVAGGPSNPVETYEVRLEPVAGRVTAFRLEVQTNAALPELGPGRGPAGNAVLTEFELALAPAAPAPIRARYVRVQAPGRDRILSLAEVEVLEGNRNVATGGTATQSSTDFEGVARRAIDGNTDGHYYAARSTTHTRTEADPWWEVDLGREVDITAVRLWNRTDGAGERLGQSRVLFLDPARKEVRVDAVATAPNPSIELGPSLPRVLRLARVSADHEQAGFPASRAADGDMRRESGWGLGGGLGKPHVLLAELAEPTEVREGDRWIVTLRQRYGERHTLGQFRLSTATSAPPVLVLPAGIAEAAAVPADQRSPEQAARLAEYFRPMSAVLEPVRRQLAALRKELDARKGTPLPVMRELVTDRRRTTRFLNKGNFLDPGETVSTGVPSAWHAWPEGAPLNRLGLAAWLTSPENPLTARVAVNRFWAQLTGQGLVETEEDFGTQGALPSHPELLDWLAVAFASPKPPEGAVPDPSKPALGWDMKGLIKLIVMSATYRQSAAVTPRLLESDPRNRMFSRAARRRLDAESVRDQALSFAGLLSGKMGGPSVYPPQPDGLWRAAFNGERTWSTSPGEDRYRRGIYTFWRRTVPYPSMATFDAPSRESCTVRRLHTNTPLQAFVTLNDPVFVEAAQGLARRILREGGATTAERLRFGLSLVLARPATGEQVRTLAELHDREFAHYRERLDEARRLATEPLGPLPDGMDLVEAAVWTSIANVLLNLDAVLTKG